jgi:hypothetical protein
MNFSPRRTQVYAERIIDLIPCFLRDFRDPRGKKIHDHRDTE